jgi:uncharacterized membrane protein
MTIQYPKPQDLRFRPRAWHLLAATMIAGSAQAGTETYQFTFLDAPDGRQSVANGINNAGQVVGTGFLSGNSDPQALIWNGAVASYLGTPGVTTSGAAAINNAGQVVGNRNQEGFVWSGPASHGLGTLGGTSSAGTSINDLGQAAGYSTLAGGTVPYAATWTGSSPTPVPGINLAYGINNAGQVVGNDTATGQPKIWNGTTTTILGGLGGTGGGAANGINNAGQVVGASGSNAVLWNGTTPTDLGTLNGTAFSTGLALNNMGEAVGYGSFDASPELHAILWDDNGPTDLNSFLDAGSKADGWFLYQAHGINDSGWIVGEAEQRLTGAKRAFLLSVSAIPEPGTLPLMLAGLGLLGLAPRRRRR